MEIGAVYNGNWGSCKPQSCQKPKDNYSTGEDDTLIRRMIVIVI